MGWMKHCDWALNMGGHEAEPIPMPPDDIQILADSDGVEFHIRYPDRSIDTLKLQKEEAEEFIFSVIKFLKDYKSGQVGFLQIHLRRTGK